MTFRVEKLEWRGLYPIMKKIRRYLYSFLTECTNVTDRRTDGRTPHDGKGRAWCAAKIVFPCQQPIGRFNLKLISVKFCAGKQFFTEFRQWDSYTCVPHNVFFCFPNVIWASASGCFRIASDALVNFNLVGFGEQIDSQVISIYPRWENFPTNFN